MTEDDLPLEARRKPIRRPLWIVGFVVYITSNVFSSIFQLDALPIVILAPLGAVSLIFNALLARLILGDHFGTQSIAGTALVTLGAILIAVFGVVEEVEHGLDELLALWRRGPFIAFFTILCVAVAAVLVTVSREGSTASKQLMQRHISLRGMRSDTSLGISYCRKTTRRTMITYSPTMLLPAPPRISRFDRQTTKGGGRPH